MKSRVVVLRGRRRGPRFQCSASSRVSPTPRAEDLALTRDDRQQLGTLQEAVAGDPMAFVGLVHAYYRDRDRAARTPRDLLYLHLGMLSGVVARLAAPPEGGVGDGPTAPVDEAAASPKPRRRPRGTSE